MLKETRVGNPNNNHPLNKSDKLTQKRSNLTNNKAKNGGACNILKKGSFQQLEQEDFHVV